MDATLHTPLLDFFRRDEVPRAVRILAARGAIAPRALEQLVLLMILSADRDPEVRETAEHTIARLPAPLLSGFLPRSDVPTDLRDFFIARGIPVAAVPSPDEPETFVDTDETAEAAEERSDEAPESVFARLAAMSVPDKVKSAMKGSREVRAILIRDPNKLVSLAVLSGPKISDAEVENYARMGSVGEDVLRAISMRRTWMKNYSVLLALVKNAKTPVAISLNLLPRVREADLKRLSTDRNIPEPLRISARKKLVLG